jgi:tetratricopeptide (TPR) repeat protein
MAEFRVGENFQYRSSPSNSEVASRLAASDFAAAVQCHRAGCLSEAERFYRRAIVFDPRQAGSFDGLGLIACKKGRFADACMFFGKAVEIDPAAAQYHFNLGNALKDLGRVDEAIEAYRQAIALKPDFAEAYGNLGSLYISQGRAGQACAAYEMAIEHRPERGSFYRLRAFCKPLPPTSPIFRKMQRLAERMSALSETDQMELHFALGTVYGDTEEHERSFVHLLAGNALKRKYVVYDEEKALGSVARVEKTFSRDFLAARSDFGIASRLPIFVVGMPRAGSTLVEQILASHPEACGAGELQILPQLLRQARSVLKTDFPEIVSTLTARQIDRLADRYLDILRSEGPTATRIVDKHLDNFMGLGLISLMLPHAKIIHIRRDPFATCLSCFAKLFNGNHLPYSYDLGELGRFYCAYERLMSHWRAVLPAGMMLEIHYEELVNDFEPQAQRIVEHCGLAWHERCHSFYRTERVVKTASALQVRQPLYATSLSKWKVYAALAQPLRVALGETDDRV